MGGRRTTEGQEGMVESLIEMLQAGALHGQIYGVRALTNLASDATARERFLSAGAAEVTASYQPHRLCCMTISPPIYALTVDAPS